MREGKCIEKYNSHGTDDYRPSREREIEGVHICSTPDPPPSLQKEGAEVILRSGIRVGIFQKSL